VVTSLSLAASASSKVYVVSDGQFVLLEGFTILATKIMVNVNNITHKTEKNTQVNLTHLSPLVASKFSHLILDGSSTLLLTYSNF